MSKNVPEIRFKGFEDEWNLIPLLSEVSIFGGLTYSPSNITPKGTLVLRSSNVKNGSIIDADNVYVDSKVVNVSNVEIGDIIMVVRNGSKALIGKHAPVLFEMPNTVIGAFMSGLRTKQTHFYDALLNTSSFSKEVNKSAGATINQITGGMFNQMVFVIPSDKEQSYIGTYFRTLTSAIIESEREVMKLEKLKAAMLQKMFPRPDNTTPEVRFKGFEGEWVCGPLSDLLEINDSRNFLNEMGREHVLSVSGEYGLVNQIEFQGRSFAGASLTGYKITHSGQVVYTKSPLKAQPFGIVKSNQYGDGLLSPLYAVYDTKNHACADFIHYYFEPVARLNNYLRPLINKGAKNTILISDETAIKGDICYPQDEKEQFYIAHFFLGLDNLLRTKRAKLAKLQTIKASCLSKMFVNTAE